MSHLSLDSRARHIGIRKLRTKTGGDNVMRVTYLSIFKHVEHSPRADSLSRRFRIPGPQYPGRNQFAPLLNDLQVRLRRAICMESIAKNHSDPNLRCLAPRICAEEEVQSFHLPLHLCSLYNFDSRLLPCRMDADGTVLALPFLSWVQCHPPRDWDQVINLHIFDVPQGCCTMKP